MGLTGNIIINLYSIILMAIVGYDNAKHKDRKTNLGKIYTWMVILTIVLLIVDIFSRFNGRVEGIYPILNRFGNLFMYLLNPLLPFLWIIYVYTVLFDKISKLRRIIGNYTFLYFCYIVSVIVSLKFDWYYKIDQENIYHRGPLFWIPVTWTISMLILSIVKVLENRKRIDREYVISLILFAVPPMVGVVLQCIMLGTSIVMNCVVISLIVVYLKIQNRNLYLDYLTGIFNRRKVDAYMEKLIENSTKAQSFSTILIDIDDFKDINDSYGHEEGDIALKSISNILKNSVKSQDLVARYGGDEFCVVLKCTKEEDLNGIIKRIQLRVKEYNKYTMKPYKINLSMGYETYDVDRNLSAKEYIKGIDERMYQEKFNNKIFRKNAN